MNFFLAVFSSIFIISCYSLLTDSPTQRRRLSSDLESARPSSLGEEELQLQLALAMSKEEHEEELKKQKNDDIKLAMAIEQSKQDNSDEVCYCAFPTELILH